MQSLSKLISVALVAMALAVVSIHATPAPATIPDNSSNNNKKGGNNNKNLKSEKTSWSSDGNVNNQWAIASYEGKPVACCRNLEGASQLDRSDIVHKYDLTCWWNDLGTLECPALSNNMNEFYRACTREALSLFGISACPYYMVSENSLDSSQLSSSKAVAGGKTGNKKVDINVKQNGKGKGWDLP